MTLTLEQLCWGIAAFYAVVWLFRKLLQIAENTLLIDDQEKRIFALEKANLDRDHCDGLQEGLQRVTDFQKEIVEMGNPQDGSEPLKVRDCRRCGKSPFKGHSITHHHPRGYLRIQCTCHPSHTSQWFKSPREVLISWNQMQAVWEGEMEQLQDIYQEMATENSPLNECACCGEDLCWVIDMEGETFRIRNSCQATQQNRGYHRTTDAAVKQWNDLQAEIEKATHAGGAGG